MSNIIKARITITHNKWHTQIMIFFIKGAISLKKIENYKIIFHLTNIKNFADILKSGLPPRSKLNIDFFDVADGKILDLRREYKLNDLIPFHFFPTNPFAGKIQQTYPEDDFMFLTLNKKFIESRMHNFYIIPSHPLHLHKNESQILYNFTDGIKKIDWDTMNSRDFNNQKCKQICMAECLTNLSIDINDFDSITVKNLNVKKEILNTLSLYNEEYGYDINIYVNVEPAWFKK